MIVEAIISVIFGIPEFILSLLPSVDISGLKDTQGFLRVMSAGLYFFPMDVWVVGIVLAVNMIQFGFAYSILEWVWKKIPGVD